LCQKFILNFNPIYEKKIAILAIFRVENYSTWSRFFSEEDNRQLELALRLVQQNNIEEAQRLTPTSIIITILMGIGIPANLFLLVVTV